MPATAASLMPFTTRPSRRWGFHRGRGPTTTPSARGATHHQALRALANRLVGILHGCLRHHTRYDEATAWHTQTDQTAAA